VKVYEPVLRGDLPARDLPPAGRCAGQRFTAGR